MERYKDPHKTNTKSLVYQALDGFFGALHCLLKQYAPGKYAFYYFCFIALIILPRIVVHDTTFIPYK